MRRTTTTWLRWGNPIGVGLALLTGTAYVYGGWLSHHERYLAPLAIALPIVALVVGILRSTSPRGLRRLASGMVWSMLTAAALLAPPAMNRAWLQRESRLLPLPDPYYAGSKGKREIDIVRFNNRDDFWIAFVTKASPKAVERLYRKELPKSGWTLIHSDKIDDQGVGVGSLQTMLFRRRGRDLEIQIMEFETHTSLEIRLRDQRLRKPVDDPRRLKNVLGGWLGTTRIEREIVSRHDRVAPSRASGPYGRGS